MACKKKMKKSKKTKAKPSAFRSLVKFIRGLIGL